jgi:transposase InsO family protein
MSARSYLLLEEASDDHDTRTQAGLALYAGRGGSPSGAGAGDSGTRNGSSGGSTKSKKSFKPRSKGSSSGAAPPPGAGSGGSTPSPRPSSTPPTWHAGINPWTGLVQAWSVPFRPPSAGVLGPRPPFQPNAAMTAHHLPPSSNAWDQSALLAALSSAGVNVQQPSPPSAGDWFFDTGATTHIASNPGNIHSVRPLQIPQSIIVGNGARLPVHHSAAATIPTATSPIQLNNVLLSPSIVKNLVSVRKLTRDNNVSVEFDSNGFSIKDLSTGTVMLRCESSGELYPLRPPTHLALTTAAVSVDLWHARLGHPGRHTLSQILHSSDFNCNKSAAHVCSSCQLGKHVRQPFSSSQTVTYFPFQLVHSDVWTSPVFSNSGYKYYLVLLDDYTHYVWTFPIRNKSDVLPLLQFFHAYIQTQFGLPWLALQTDNGREFDNVALRSFFLAHGVQLRLSCPYTSQQNGKAERILRTLNDCMRTLLLHSAAPSQFWAEALSTATYLINRRPCRATGTTTPHELLLGTPIEFFLSSVVEQANSVVNGTL